VIEEVIVTAQKRSERLQDVPMTVSVIDAQALVDSNQTQLHEYFNQIPGLTLAQSTIGPSIVSIRGITSGINQNPTVGFTLDDIPLGASTNNGAVGLVPEVNPADLARIEVLKGPQGTLYGASSMGGLIRFVTVDPSTHGIYGRVEAGTSTVFNGQTLGYDANGSINVPIGDSFAVRASGFVRSDPGYIDNVQTGERGVNGEDISGGHLSALWRLSSDFSLKLSALLENDNRHGSNDVNVPTPGFPQTTNLGDLQQSYLIGTGYYDRQIQVYSATLSGRAGGFDLTAVTGYNVNSFSASEDFSFYLVACNNHL
jgi:outer membrane receptor protein involved in Fe transport